MTKTQATLRVIAQMRAANPDMKVTIIDHETQPRFSSWDPEAMTIVGSGNSKSDQIFDAILDDISQSQWEWQLMLPESRFPAQGYIGAGVIVTGNNDQD